MEERDKDISDIRKERDDAVTLLQRMIHATRPRQFYIAPSVVEDVRRKALNWIERKGLGGNIIR
jgi:hypothetical protein